LKRELELDETLELDELNVLDDELELLLRDELDDFDFEISE
jgi:hypothetical protein